MPPKERTTNFKTWEAQSRLLAALVASIDARLDYKTIAKNYGGGATTSAMEHRFRVVKAQADAIKEAHLRGVDPGSVNICDIRTRDEIQTLFGGSTPDGIQFQFRNIKAGAKVLSNAVAMGEDPKAAFDRHLAGSADAAGSVPATPTHRSTPGSIKRARSTTKTATPASGATPATKRRKAIIKPEPDFDNDEDSTEQDYSELDVTPTKPRFRQPANQLLPRERWEKPPPGAPVPRSSFYNQPLATSPSSAAPAAPNGYTNQNAANGTTYSAASTVAGDAQSVAVSPIIATSTARRDSGLSAASASYPSFPSASAPAPDSSMTMSFAATNHLNTSQQPSVAKKGMNNNNNIDPASFTIYDAAGSPSTIASEDNTPRSPVSTKTMAATEAAPAPSRPPVKTAPPFPAPSPYGHFGNDYAANNNAPANHGYAFDHNEVDAAGLVEFSHFDDEFIEDVGDC